jgi:hypothetical protein
MAYKAQHKDWQKPVPLKVGYSNHDRFVGTYDPNKNIYRKYVRESEHLFRKLDAWGIDAKLFNELILPKSAVVVITDNETNRVYQTTAKNIGENGRYFHFKEGDVSHKAQIFLSRAYWIRTTDMSGKSAPIVDPRLLDKEGMSSPVVAEKPKVLTPELVAEHNREMQKLWNTL